MLLIIKSANAITHPIMPITASIEITITLLRRKIPQRFVSSTSFPTVVVLVERSTTYFIRLKGKKQRQRILYKQYYSTFDEICQVILKFIIFHKIKVIVLLDVIYLSISKHTNFETICCRFDTFCSDFHITNSPTLQTHQV